MSYLFISFCLYNRINIILFEDSFNFKGQFFKRILFQNQSWIDRRRKYHYFCFECFTRFFLFSLCCPCDCPYWNQILLGLSFLCCLERLKVNFLINYAYASLKLYNYQRYFQQFKVFQSMEIFFTLYVSQFLPISSN
jgi:hypothetical protein